MEPSDMTTFLEPRLMDATFASIFAMRLLNAEARGDDAYIAETKAHIEANYGRDGLALVNVKMGERLMIAHHSRVAETLTPAERVQTGREEAEYWARVVMARTVGDARRRMRRAIEGYCAVLCAYGIPISPAAGGGWTGVQPEDDVTAWWEKSNAARIAAMVVWASADVPVLDVE